VIESCKHDVYVYIYIYFSSIYRSSMGDEFNHGGDGGFTGAGRGGGSGFDMVFFKTACNVCCMAPAQIPKFPFLSQGTRQNTSTIHIYYIQISPGTSQYLFKTRLRYASMCWEAF